MPVASVTTDALRSYCAGLPVRGWPTSAAALLAAASTMAHAQASASKVLSLIRSISFVVPLVAARRPAARNVLPLPALAPGRFNTTHTTGASVNRRRPARGVPNLPARGAGADRLPGQVGPRREDRPAVALARVDER